MTAQSLESLLAEGGKTNSLGRVDDVISIVLDDKSRVDELYSCLSHENAWVRMRAADAFEKICRIRPEWISQYIPAIQRELSGSHQQASIKWHIAEIYAQVPLNDAELKFAISWLSEQLQSTEVDWIVSANCMKTLSLFADQNQFPKSKLQHLLEIQMGHKSKSVVRKASQISASLS